MSEATAGRALAEVVAKHLGQLKMGDNTEEVRLVAHHLKDLQRCLKAKRADAGAVDMAMQILRSQIFAASLGAKPVNKSLLACCNGEDFQAKFANTDLSLNAWKACVADVGLRSVSSEDNALFKKFRSFFGVEPTPLPKPPAPPQKRLALLPKQLTPALETINPRVKLAQSTPRRWARLTKQPRHDDESGRVGGVAPVAGADGLDELAEEFPVRCRLTLLDGGAYELVGRCSLCDDVFTMQGSKKQRFNGHAKGQATIADHVAEKHGRGLWSMERNLEEPDPSKRVVWTREGPDGPLAKRAKRDDVEAADDEDGSDCDTRVGPAALVRLAAECGQFPKQLLPSDARVVKSKGKKGFVIEVGSAGDGAMREKAELPGPWPGLGAVPADLPRDFKSLVLLGRSGSGKSSLLRTLLTDFFPGYGGPLYPEGEWQAGRPVIEGFPHTAAGVEWLCSVGLSSVPAWLKPFGVLSRGEQYRANAARQLATRGATEPAVFDEWTSELDRGVAKAASLALAKALARRKRQGEDLGPVIFASCHDDVVEYLGCDVVVRCESGCAPRVVYCRDSSAGAPDAALPQLHAAMCGSMEVPTLGCQATAVEGRWRAGSAFNGRPLDFTIKVSERKKVPASKSAASKVCKAEMPTVWRQFHLTCSPFGTSAMKAEGEQASEATGNDTSVWLGADMGGSRLRLRPKGPGTLVVQMSNCVDEDTSWSEFSAHRVTTFSHCGRSPSLASVSSGSTPYAKDMVRCFHTSGWYLPVERLGKDVDGLYEGLGRGTIRWLGRLGEQGEGFRLDPKHEHVEEGLTYLAAYVGSPDGSLSEQTTEASCYMDTPFNGLSLHEVPQLPEGLGASAFALAAIVGPSGSGKSALAAEHFGEAPCVQWAEHAPIRAHLPEGVAGEELLDAVGLAADVASRPWSTLSGGEQFRARLARLLAWKRDDKEVLVVDEFTSVLDRATARQVARTMQSYVSRHGLRRVLVVSCHRDFVGKGLLEPDWIFEAGSGRMIHFEDPLASSLRDLMEERKAAEAALAFRIEAMSASGRAAGVELAKLRETAVATTSQTPEFVASLVGLIVAEQATHESRMETQVSAARTALPLENEALAADFEDRAAKLREQHAAVMPRGRAGDDEVGDSVASELPQAVPASLPSRLKLEVRRALPCEWSRFREHHYKDHKLGGSNVAFVGTLLGEPVGFVAVLPAGQNMLKLFLSKETKFNGEWTAWREASYPEAWIDRVLFREHRTVVMPSFQGIGLGSLLCDSVANLFDEMGYAFVSMTVHPQYGGYRDRSAFWTALPTSRIERSGIKGNLKYCHAWVGATKPDDSIDWMTYQLLLRRLTTQQRLSSEAARIDSAEAEPMDVEPSVMPLAADSAEAELLDVQAIAMPSAAGPSTPRSEIEDKFTFSPSGVKRRACGRQQP